MERITFLIEETGLRLGCLLNPENLDVRRLSGVQPRRSWTRPLSGSGLSDDALIFTGGGRTEMDLKLVFDLSLAGSSIQSDDVRELTRPLWELAENAAFQEGPERPPTVRFVWGKAWNIPGVVLSVAERFEQFTRQGKPRRSWMRMHLLRLPEPIGSPDIDQLPPSPEIDAENLDQLEVPEEHITSHEVIGDEQSSQRIDEIAANYWGHPSLWKPLAAFNGIDNPLAILPGTVLRIPPLSLLLAHRSEGSA